MSEQQKGGPEAAEIAVIDPKLTPKQAEALAEVCRTNGGGVYVRCNVGADGYGVPVNPQMRKLHSLGLIQGKAGGYDTVVHTREGWRLNAMLRARIVEQSK